MNTTELIKPSRPPRASNPGSGTRKARSPDFEPPTFRRLHEEVLPLLSVVAVAGPPVGISVAAWVLFALLLTGPFMLLVTLVLVGVVLLAVTAAIVTPPYLLVRRLRRYRTHRPNRRAPVHRLRERLAIGASLITQPSQARLFSSPAVPPSAAASLHDPIQLATREYRSESLRPLMRLRPESEADPHDYHGGTQSGAVTGHPVSHATRSSSRVTPVDPWR